MPRPTYPKLEDAHLSAFKQKLGQIHEKLPARLNLSTVIGIQSSSTLSRYMSGDTGPPPQRLVAIALVGLHLEDPAAYADANNRLAAAIEFVQEVGYADQVSHEKLEQLVKERYQDIRDRLMPEEAESRRDRQQMLANFRPTIANRLDLCNRSQSNYAEELRAYIKEEYEPMRQPCALVFVWQWCEDKTPAGRLDPGIPGPGKQAIGFLSGLLRDYPNFCLIGLLTGLTDKEPGESGGHSREVMGPLEGFYKNVITWLNSARPEQAESSDHPSKGRDKQAETGPIDRIEDRVQLFYGTRKSYVHIFDSQICLGTVQKEPAGYSVTDNGDLYELIERVESGLENEPWLWSSMVTALDTGRTGRLLDYFGIRLEPGKKPLGVFPPWRIDPDHKDWGWTSVGPNGDALFVD